MAFKTGSQNDTVVARLEEGPVTNSELVRKFGIFKYTSRISDLRAAGYVVNATDLGDGLWRYTLVK